MYPAAFRAAFIGGVLAGKPVQSWADEVGLPFSTVKPWLRQAGVMVRRGMPRKGTTGGAILPPPAKGFGAQAGHGRRLQLADRVLIEMGIAHGQSPTLIAQNIGVHRATVFREIDRHTLWAVDGRWGRTDTHYSAALAQYWADMARPAPRTPSSTCSRRCGGRSSGC